MYLPLGLPEALTRVTLLLCRTSTITSVASAFKNDGQTTSDVDVGSWGALIQKQDIGHVGGLLLVLSTQLLGFGLAGLTYSFLVRPTNMVWPSSLVIMTMYNTLHAKPIGTARRRLAQEEDLMSKRFRFFLIVFVLISIYQVCLNLLVYSSIQSDCLTDKRYGFNTMYSLSPFQFLPTVFAPTLSSIATMCLINNNSQFMRVLGSACKFRRLSRKCIKYQTLSFCCCCIFHPNP